MRKSRVFGFEEVWQSLFAQARFTLIILTTFAGTGLLLVAIGIYGVIAYGVAQRTQEFGIRLALGAQRADLLRGVMWSAARLVVVGASAGLVASMVTNRLIVRSAPDVSPYDPWTMGTALGVIAVTSLVACLIPALRAARTEPMTALRAE